jgi:hypothetical protein
LTGLIIAWLRITRPLRLSHSKESDHRTHVYPLLPSLIPADLFFFSPLQSMIVMIEMIDGSIANNVI